MAKSPFDVPSEAPSSEALQARISELEAERTALLADVQKHRALLDALPLGVTISDPDGHIIESNQESVRLLGISKEEHAARAIDRGGWQIVRPDGSPMPSAEYASVRALKEQRLVRDVELGIVREDGHTIWLSVTAAPIPAEGFGVAVAYLDVTPRKEAAAALARSEALLAEMARMANVGAWELDVASGRVEWTDEVCRIHEVSSDYEPELSTALAFYHPDDRPTLEAAIQQSIADGSGWDLELRIITARRREVWVRAIGRTELEDGRVTRLMGTFQDIDVRKRAELALRESKARLARAAALTRVGHWTWYADSNVVDWTDEVYRLHGYEPGEVALDLELALSHIRPDDRAKVEACLRNALENRSDYSIEYRFIRRDGSEGVLKALGDVIVDERGVAIGLDGSAQDITEMRQAEDERRRLQDQLLHTQKLESLGVLAGGIAHDFNNLLVGILGNADLALDEVSPNSAARPHLQGIETAAKRAADLARQMLAYSGKGKFLVELLDVNELVQEMTHLLEVSVSKAAVIKYNLAANLPAVEADATQIRQVIMNLITNASEAIADRSGVISITTGVMQCDAAYLDTADVQGSLTEGTYVYLEVADTGSGMDAETQERIFDPFFTTKFTGRGLGLAAVLGIVRGHQGALKLYSEPGRGSTFKILLPASDQQFEEHPVVMRQARSASAGGTILLVDDDETVCLIGQQMLNRAGFTVRTASDGAAAVEVFRRAADEIDCVVLDLTMPHMDGEVAFRELRRIRPDVPVILSSGYNEQEIVQRFAGKGLAGFVQKPYRSRELIEKICSVIG